MGALTVTVQAQVNVRIKSNKNNFLYFIETLLIITEYICEIENHYNNYTIILLIMIKNKIEEALIY